MADNDSNKLSKSDQKKVDDFLNSGVNQAQRPGFRPWKLCLSLAVIVIVLGVLARVVGTVFLPY